MAAVALEIIDGAIVRRYLVAGAGTVTRGYPVMLSGADNTIVNQDATDHAAIGIALDAGTAGQEVRVALYGKGIAKGHVGAGGCTRNQIAVYAAAGLDGATPAAGAAAIRWSSGQFLESANANEFAAVNLGPAGWVTSA